MPVKSNLFALTFFYWIDLRTFASIPRPRKAARPCHVWRVLQLRPDLFCHLSSSSSANKTTCTRKIKCDSKHTPNTSLTTSLLRHTVQKKVKISRFFEVIYFISKTAWGILSKLGRIERTPAKKKCCGRVGTREFKEWCDRGLNSALND